MVLVKEKPKALPVHHQKRTAQHHKKTQPYHKTYWPYLPLLAIVGFTFLINIVWSRWTPSSGQVLGATTGITADALLAETNQDRQAQHSGALSIDPKLSQAAQAKAQDMAKNNYWAHMSPSGQSPWGFINDTGYQYQAAGENLAYGFNSSSALVNGWMNSREHRANVLNSAYQQVGFGIVQAADFQGAKSQTIVVAMYAQPAQVIGYSPHVTDTNQSSHQVVRLELFAGNAVPGAMYMLVIVATGAAMLVVLRHLRFAHRVFAYSEAFIVRHPMLDVALVGIASAGILLSRTSGFIH